MLPRNERFDQTRHRFRYNENTIAQRVNVTNKQRIYKQILDDQLEQKRRRQSQEKPKVVEQRAWYVNPEDSYHPYPMIPMTPKVHKHLETHEGEEERPGYSRFITDPRDFSPNSRIEPEDDSQVQNYLQQCEKILTCLKGLTVGSTTPTSSHKVSDRRFITLNRSRNLLSNSNLQDIQDRYNRNYSNKLPHLSHSQLDSTKGKGRLGTFVNLVPSTHKLEPLSLSNHHTQTTQKDGESRLAVSQIHTIPISHSRQSADEASRKNALQTQKSESDQLEQRSRKSQLELNKQRLRTLAKQPIHPEHHTVPLPANNSASKSGQRIMTHLIRVKAHGYKLFQKVQKYKRVLPYQPQIKQI